MPRPKKCRKVCRLPKTEAFVPQPSCASGEAVILTVDEYEAIRLIDREGFSQEELELFYSFLERISGNMLALEEKLKK